MALHIECVVKSNCYFVLTLHNAIAQSYIAARLSNGVLTHKHSNHASSFFPTIFQ